MYRTCTIANTGTGHTKSRKPKHKKGLSRKRGSEKRENRSFLLPTTALYARAPALTNRVFCFGQIFRPASTYILT